MNPMLLVIGFSLAAQSANDCPAKELLRIGGTPVLSVSGAIAWKAGMSVDADGAPKAYHPRPKQGLDCLANAGHPGDWWALVTDTGKPDGQPILQGPTDPAPGFYVSTTSLQNVDKPVSDPRRYVDASTVPYIAVSPVLRDKAKVKLGDFVVVTNGDRRAFAIVADIGPKQHLGEGSIALAEALGLPSNACHGGGAKKGVRYVAFPGSGNGKPRTLEEIQQHGAKLLEAFGGEGRVATCLP